MSQLLLLNPKRRKARKSTKRRTRSAAQKAATRRMLAARRNPVAKKSPARRRSRRSAAFSPSTKRRARRAYASGRAFTLNSVVPLLKSGAIGGAGAVLNDIAFSYAAKILPDSMAAPVDATGSTNLMHFAAKAATAVAIATAGRRVPGLGRYAGDMGAGALTVLAYQLIRPQVPASVMGAYNPVPLMAPRRSLNGVGAYVNRAPRLAGMGAYVNTAPNVTAMSARVRKLA